MQHEFHCGRNLIVISLPHHNRRNDRHFLLLNWHRWPRPCSTCMLWMWLPIGKNFESLLPACQDDAILVSIWRKAGGSHDLPVITCTYITHQKLWNSIRSILQRTEIGGTVLGVFKSRNRSYLRQGIQDELWVWYVAAPLAHCPKLLNASYVFCAVERMYANWSIDFLAKSRRLQKFGVVPKQCLLRMMLWLTCDDELSRLIWSHYALLH